MKSRFIRYPWLVVLAIFTVVHIPFASAQTEPPIPVYNAIQSNTEACYVGTAEHPQRYCADSTPCKAIPNGGTVCLKGTAANLVPAGATVVNDLACWQYKTPYTCLQRKNECAGLESDRNCAKVSGPTCLSDANGNPIVDAKTGLCINKSFEYTCPSSKDLAQDIEDYAPDKVGDVTQEDINAYNSSHGNPTTTITTSCNVTDVGNDGLSWETNTPSGVSEFGNAILMQEIAREAAATSNNASGEFDNFFPGKSYKCRVGRGTMFLKKCCRSESGMSDYQLAMSLGQKVLGAFGVSFYGEQGGSKYDYIALYVSMGVAVYTVAAAAIGAAIGAAAGTAAAAAAGAASTAVVNMASQAAAAGPYIIVIIIVIYIMLTIMECNEDELALAVLKGEGICQKVGDYCDKSNKVEGCIIRQHVYCCYQSQIAKGIQKIAGAQYGIGFGSAKSPRCGGMTAEQLTKLNFDSPEAQEVVQSLVGSVLSRNVGTYEGNTNQVQSNMTGVANSTAIELCLERKATDPRIQCQ